MQFSTRLIVLRTHVHQSEIIKDTTEDLTQSNKWDLELFTPPALETGLTVAWGKWTSCKTHCTQNSRTFIALKKGKIYTKESARQQHLYLYYVRLTQPENSK